MSEILRKVLMSVHFTPLHSTLKADQNIQSKRKRVMKLRSRSYANDMCVIYTCAVDEMRNSNRNSVRHKFTSHRLTRGYKVISMILDNLAKIFRLFIFFLFSCSGLFWISILCLRNKSERNFDGHWTYLIFFLHASRKGYLCCLYYKNKCHIKI